MPSNLDQFEAIARALARLPRQEPATEPAAAASALHPFDSRTIHPDLPIKVRELFDDGYYSEATFEAFKYLDKTVEKHSGITESGSSLMMKAFSETNPKLPLTAMKTTS